MIWLSGRQSSSRPVTLIALGFSGFLLAFGAVGLVLTPRVASFEPSTGGWIGGYTPVQIQFTSPMDPDSTENRLSIQPAQSGRIEWKGSTLRFIPVARWPDQTPVTVTLQAGARSAQGLPMLSGRSFTFQTAQPRITYLESAEGVYRLRIVDAAGKESSELIQVDSPIQDYAVSPRGDFILFTRGAYAGSSNLWILPMDTRTPTLLLDCGGDACRNPSISPDSEWAAYERSAVRTGNTGAVEPALPRVEVIRISNPVPAAVSPANHIAANPIWAPAGWLSYFNATDRVITVEDRQGGRTFIPNATGEAWTWAPDSLRLVFPEMTILEPDDHGEEHPLIYYSHLYLATLGENSRENLSVDSQLEDSSPAFSPDGQWLLFIRNYFDDRWTPGSQIWRMNAADGSASAVTALPEFGHSSIRWKADGSAFVFMRFHATAPGEPPEIWLADSSGGNAIRLVTGGYAPQWLP